MEDNVIISSSQQTVGMNAANISLLKLGTFGQTILGVVVTGFVVAATVATIALISTRVGFEPPRANPDYVIMEKNTIATIRPLANDIDPRGGKLKVTKVGRATYGTVQIATDFQTVIYTANKYYAGNDTFEYVVSNDKQSAKSFVHLNITNNAPEATDFAFRVSRNSKDNQYPLFEITQEARSIVDVDNDEMIIVGTSTPENGQVWFTDKILYYTPNEGFKKNETITYTISDHNDTSTAEITFAVVNDPPVANPNEYMLPKNQLHYLRILDNAYDANNDTISIISFGFSRGLVQIQNNGTHVSYLALPGTDPYTDSFEYTIQDSEDATAQSYTTMRIFNTPPVAHNGTFSIVKNTEANRADIQYEDYDRFDVHNAKIVEGPFHGTAKLFDSKTDQRLMYPDGQTWIEVPKYAFYIEYTPDAGSDLNDYIKFKIDDSYDPGYGYVNFVVTNTAPVAVEESIRCSKNNFVEFDVVENDYDPNGDEIELVFPTSEIKSQNGGIITKKSAREIKYVPKSKFTGDDSFEYTIRDITMTPSKSLTAVGKVSVNVFNEAPVANPDKATVNRYKSVTVSVLDNDSDPNRDPLTVVSVGDASSGTSKKDESGKTVTFTADGTIGKISFTYTIADDEGLTSESTVTVDVINTKPIANDDTTSVLWNRTVSINVLSNDYDEDGDALSVASFTQPSQGTLRLVGDLFVYEANDGFVGTDTFTYFVSDGIDMSVQAATVTIKVNNNAPVAKADSASVHWATDSGVSIDVLANDSDPDEDPIYIRSVSGASNGQIAIITLPSGRQGIKYTPNKPFVGVDTFTYKISDWDKDHTASVTVDVTNTRPVPYADQASVHWRDGSIVVNVLANDKDADRDAFSIHQITKQPSKGRADIENPVDGTIRYTLPTPPELNSVSFEYNIADAQVSSQSAIVTVGVTNANKPTVSNISRRLHWRVLNENGYTEFNVYNSQTDLDGDTLKLTIARTPSNGQALVYSSGSGSVETLRFKNTQTWMTGTTDFDYKLSDGISSSTATVSVDVYNRKPVAANIEMELVPSKVKTGTTINVIPLSSDPDPEDSGKLSVVSVNSQTITAGAQVELQPGNLIFYKPKADWIGTDNFTYVLTDGLESTTGHISVTVKYLKVEASNKFYNIHWTDTKPSGVLFNVTDGIDETKTLSLTGVFTKRPNRGGTIEIKTVGGIQYISYTQAVGVLGVETFEVEYTDGVTKATIAVTVEIENKAPTPANKVVTQHWSVVKSGYEIDVIGSYIKDVDGDSLSLSSVTMVKGKGSVEMVNGKALYRPPPAQNNLAYVGSGEEQFRYVLSDGIETGYAVVDVNIINKKPKANEKSFEVHWSSYKSDLVLDVINSGGTKDSDDDNDQLSVYAVGTATPTVAGTVSLSAGKVVIKSPTIPTFVQQTFRFEYTLSDGAETVKQMVNVLVTNTPPTATDSNSRIHWRSPNADIVVISNRVQADGDTLTVTAVTSNLGSTSGRVSGHDGVITYRPLANFLGDETLSFTISDGIQTAVGTVIVTVYNGNPVTKAFSLRQLWSVSSSFTFNILGDPAVTDPDDLDKPHLTITRVTGLPSGDSSTITAGKVVINHPSKNPGVFKLTYYVSDGKAEVSGLITLDIFNNAPTIGDASLSPVRIYGQSTYSIANVMTAAVDPDGDALTLSVVSGGQVLGSAGVSVVIPEFYTGNKVVEYYCTDSKANSNVAKATFTFVNIAPTCQDATMTLNKGETKSVTVTCQDGNNDPIIFSAVSALPTGLTLAASSRTFTYAAPSQSNTLQVTYQGKDGANGSSGVKTLTIQVQNRAPQASNYVWNINPAMRKSGSNRHEVNFRSVSSASDPDGDALQFSVESSANTCTAVSGVQVSMSGDTLIFQRPFTYSQGSCSFKVKVQDNDAKDPKSILVTVTINLQTSPPTAVGRSYEVEQREGDFFTLTEDQIMVEDYDPLGGTKKFVGFVDNCSGGYKNGYCRYAPVKVGTGLWQFRKGSNECQTDRFTYKITTVEDPSQTATAVLDIRFIKCQCVKPLDVVFVLDGSGSVGSTNFANMKRFVKDIVASFDIGSGATQTMVGAVLFSTGVDDHFELTSSKSTFNTKMDGMRYPNGMTNILIGYMKAKELLMKGRDKTKYSKLIITLFDGEPNYPCSCSQCSNIFPRGEQDCTNSPRYPFRDCNSCFSDSPLRCSPCADCIPITQEINSWKPGNPNGYWRNMVIGVGPYLNNYYAKQLITDMSYDSKLSFSVDWSQLQQIIDKIKSQSCDLIDTAVPTTPSNEKDHPGYYYCGQIVAIHTRSGYYASIKGDNENVLTTDSSAPNYSNTRKTLFQITNCGTYGTLLSVNSQFSLWSLQNNRYLQKVSSNFRPNADTASTKFYVKSGSSPNLMTYEKLCLATVAEKYVVVASGSALAASSTSSSCPNMYFEGVSYNEVSYRVNLSAPGSFPTPIPSSALDKSRGYQ